MPIGGPGSALWNPQQMPVTSQDNTAAPPTDVSGVTGTMAPAPPPPPQPTFLPPQGMISQPPPTPMPQGPQPTSDQDLGPGLPPAYTGPANRGGPVKNALTRMLYGMGQSMMGAAGLPTDYDIQRSNFEQALKAGQLQVQQAHERLLQQQQALVPVTFANGTTAYLQPAVAAKVMPAQITAQGRLDVANLNAQKQTLDQRLSGAIANVTTKGGDPRTDPQVQALIEARNQLQKQSEMQQFIANDLQSRGIDPATASSDEWLGAHQRYLDTKATTSSTVQWVQNAAGDYVPLPKTTVRRPASGAPAAAASPATTPAGGAVSPAVPTTGINAARTRIPPGSTAGRTLGGTAGGAPVQGPGANKWVTWTEPDGRQVAGSAAEAAQARAADPSISPAALQGSEVKDLMNARQNYRNLTKVGDPTKPETMGVLQLIDSLDKDGKLGLLASRWNNFMTTGVGASPGDDPRIITLLNKNTLGATGAMLAHFGASGGRSPQMLQHFLDMMNAAKMDGPTLKAGVKAIADYMGDRSMIPTPRAGGGGRGARNAPPAASSGFFGQYGGTAR